MNNLTKYALFLLILVQVVLVKSEDDVHLESIPNEPTKPENGTPEPESQEKSIQPNELDSLPSYINLTGISVAENVTTVNATETTNRTDKFVSCLPYYDDAQIHIVNDTELIKILTSNTNITSRDTPANCTIVLFYSKYCPFSSMAAPHFNALPRAFPTVKMVAINAMIYHIFNAQYGVVGVPSLVLFHNGKPIAKFNESEYTLELFSKFITKYTGIQPEEKSFVTSADFSGPVFSVPSKENDIWLILCWVFIIVCAVYYFSKSKYWTWIVETVQNTWRESEAQAQHEHND